LEFAGWQTVDDFDVVMDCPDRETWPVVLLGDEERPLPKRSVATRNSFVFGGVEVAAGAVDQDGFW
jgi:hypothetical protein